MEKEWKMAGKWLEVLYELVLPSYKPPKLSSEQRSLKDVIALSPDLVLRDA